MTAFARPPTEEMAKAHGSVKHSAMVAKSMPRDPQSESDAAMRRAPMESVTSETSTVDRHPILARERTAPGADEDDDRETDTKRAATAPPSVLESTQSVTLDAPTHVELSPDHLEADEPAPGEASNSEIITERREVEPRESAPPPPAIVLPRRAVPGKHLDDETMPMLVGDISGALETVPLPAALLANVLAQVDARAAAKAAQAQQHAQPPVQPPPVEASPVARPPVAPAPLVNPFAPQRRIGVEIAIAAFTFLLVAVPALYFLLTRR